MTATESGVRRRGNSPKRTGTFGLDEEGKSRRPSSQSVSSDERAFTKSRAIILLLLGSLFLLGSFFLTRESSVIEDPLLKNDEFETEPNHNEPILNNPHVNNKGFHEYHKSRDWNSMEELRNATEGNRYLSLIHTDKEIYREDDIVYFRVFLSNALDQHMPKTHERGPEERESVFLNPSTCPRIGRIELERPDHSTVDVGVPEMSIKNDACSFTGSFSLSDQGTGGGMYKLYVRGDATRFDEYEAPASKTVGFVVTPSWREFQVRVSSRTNPTLSGEISFERMSYSAGNRVVATVKDVRVMSTGMYASGASVIAMAKVGGSNVFESEDGKIRVDQDGSCRVEFSLPEEIARDTADAVLTVRIRYGALVSSVSKTIPLVTQSIDINVFPESGDLVEGMETRIYVQGLSITTGEPADFGADIVAQIDDHTTKKVASVQTVHEGRGVSSVFTVTRNTRYQLVVTSPASVKMTVDLRRHSSSTATGVISMENYRPAVFKADETISLRVQGKEGYSVGLFKREKLLDQVSLPAGAGETRAQVVRFKPIPSSLGDGVLRATLFNEQSIPVAERLIFRHPRQRLVTVVRPLKGVDQKLRGSPRNTVTLQVESFLAQDGDNTKQPVQAVVGLLVSDLSRLSLIESRRRVPRLPQAVYLEAEVEQLFDAPAYATDNEKLDLLLGTAGWRRFVYSKPEEELKNNDKFLRLIGLVKPPHSQAPVQFLSKHPVMMMARGAPEMAMEAEEMDMVMMNEAGAVPLADDAFGAMPPVNAMENDVELMDVAPPRFGKFFPGQRYRPGYEREYAHVSKSKSATREDFTETLLWKLEETKQMPDGSYALNVTFDLSDSVTTFRGFVEGSDGRGSWGSTVFDLTSSLPLQLDTKLPVQLIAGDKVLAPVSIQANSDDVDLVDVSIRLFSLNNATDRLKLAFDLQGSKSNVPSIEGAKLSSPMPKTRQQEQHLEGHARLASGNGGGSRVFIPLAATMDEDPTSGALLSNTTFSVELSAAPKITHHLRGISLNSLSLVDNVKRSTQVRMGGFPAFTGTSGMLTPGSHIEYVFEAPSHIVKESFKVTFVAFLSPVDLLIDVLAALIREPCGCFEQTSSTTYPMVLALRYLVGMKTRDARLIQLIEKARAHIRDGYQKLISYETSSGGFEWFGKAPGHEALTAYGLVQFAEMSRGELGLGNLVDQKMLARTKDWLVSRRDGEGGFLRSEQALDSFGRAPTSTTNAYILWSLARAHLVTWSLVEKEVTLLKEQLQQRKDPYVMALTASILQVFQKEPVLSNELLHSLADMQQEQDGCIVEDLTLNVTFSTITSSMGKAKMLEGTAMSALAWMQAIRAHSDNKQFMRQVRSAIDCVAGKISGGSFGNTQATALSLQAIIEFNELVQNQILPTNIRLGATDGDGNDLTKPLAFPVSPSNPESVLQELVENSLAQPGQSVRFKVSMDAVEDATSDFQVPFILGIDFHTTLPASSENCALDVSINLESDAVKEGGLVELEVSVSNKNDTKVPMSVAKIGIPAGTEARFDHLREMSETGKIAHFETHANFVILYWYGFHALEEKKITIQLEATIPGTYQAPATSVYVYYNDDTKAWVEGPRLNILPSV